MLHILLEWGPECCRMVSQSGHYLAGEKQGPPRLPTVSVHARQMGMETEVALVHLKIPV